MDQTLQQLGELLLGAVPTVILLALLYALYTVIVHKPLRRVLEERRSKTEGAIEKSKADIAAAEARTSEYEQSLREARAAVFRAQEARRQAAMQARAKAVAEARKRAQAQVQTAQGRASRKIALPPSKDCRPKRQPWPRRSCAACCNRRERDADEGLLEARPGTDHRAVCYGSARCWFRAQQPPPPAPNQKSSGGRSRDPGPRDGACQ